MNLLELNVSSYEISQISLMLTQISKGNDLAPLPLRFSSFGISSALQTGLKFCRASALACVNLGPSMPFAHYFTGFSQAPGNEPLRRFPGVEQPAFHHIPNGLSISLVRTPSDTLVYDSSSSWPESAEAFLSL